MKRNINAVVFAVAWLIGAGMVGSNHGQRYAMGTEPDWKSVKLPLNPAYTKGFTCTIETIGATSEGYLTLRVVANSTAGPFPGDRQIRMRVEPKRGMAQPWPSASCEMSFLLPAGKTTMTETFYIPKYFQSGCFDVSLSDGNGSLKSYDAGFNVAINGSLQGPQSMIAVSDWLTRFAVILPDSGTATEPWQRIPDLRTMESGLTVDTIYATNFLARQTDIEAATYIDAQSKLVHQRLYESSAHEHWLGYESVDVVLVAFPLLESMKSRQPTRYEALRDWVSCGGVVWMYAVPSDQSLAELFEVEPPGTVAWRSRDMSVPITDIERAVAKFQPGARTPRIDSILNPYAYSNFGGPNQAANTDPLSSFPALPGGEPHPFSVIQTPAELETILVQMPVEAGVVIGLKETDPFPGSLQKWFVAKDLSGANQVWRHRRATTIMRGNSQYWSWLMSKVARPPVYAFLGLLTVFVLLVGPVSYYFTRRAGRSYLMFMVAPALATITTLLLFGYGIVADGFGTKVRSRQVTWVDGTSGRASQMNLSTYFASFRPQSGLRFSADAAVYPALSLEQVTAERISGSLRIDRTVEIRDGQQIFRGEYLPARTQTQFISYQPVKTVTGVSAVTADGQVTITNHFTDALTSLFLRLPDGTYATLEKSLDGGASATVAPLPSEKVGAAIRSLYRLHQPANPPGYLEPQGYDYRWYEYRNANAVLAGLPNSWENTNDALGIYESTLRFNLMERGSLPLNTFFGILETTDAASAVPGAENSESVHYVMGTMSKVSAKRANTNKATAKETSQ